MNTINFPDVQTKKKAARLFMKNAAMIAITQIAPELADDGEGVLAMSLSSKDLNDAASTYESKIFSLEKDADEAPTKKKKKSFSEKLEEQAAEYEGDALTKKDKTPEKVSIDRVITRTTLLRAIQLCEDSDDLQEVIEMCTGDSVKTTALIEIMAEAIGTDDKRITNLVSGLPKKYREPLVTFVEEIIKRHIDEE